MRSMKSGTKIALVVAVCLLLVIMNRMREGLTAMPGLATARPAENVEDVLQRLFSTNKPPPMTTKPYDIQFTMNGQKFRYRFTSVKEVYATVKNFLLAFPASPPTNMANPSMIFAFFGACRYLQKIGALTPGMNTLWNRSRSPLKKKGYSWTSELMTPPPRRIVFTATPRAM